MDKKTIDTYNKRAQEYDGETFDFWDKFPRTFPDTFIGLVKGKVLDVGSGPGRDGLILQTGGLDVTCLDASPEMVRLCTERGLRAVVGDFMKLPYDNESFGGVWAYTALLHVPKVEVSTALQEMRRVLVSGGTFGLGMIEGETEEYRESSGVNLPRWFSYYTSEELKRYLSDSGFEVTYFENFKPGKRNYLHFIAKKI